MRIKNNKFSPSDMNTILAGAGDYTEDGMEPIHQRHYNQHYNLEKYENDELNQIFDELRNTHDWGIKVTHSSDDYDLYNIRFSNFGTGQSLLFTKIADADDLLVTAQNKVDMYNNSYYYKTAKAAKKLEKDIRDIMLKMGL